MILKARVENPQSLKLFLQGHFGLSSRILTRLKKEKCVFVNGKYRHMNFLLNTGDEIWINLDFDTNSFPLEEREIDVVYEDESILAINKDANLTVHPTKGTPRGTLLNAVAYYASKKGEDYKVRFANRLDRDTTGVIIVAKNKYIDHKLSRQFIERSPEKFYLALVEGYTEDDFLFQGPMDRLEGEFRRRIMEGGKDSLTYFSTIARKNGISLVSCRPVTGRTHQLRLHLSELGHPILGDELYGYSGKIERTMLHCERMVIHHPITGKELELHALPKRDMMDLLEDVYE